MNSITKQLHTGTLATVALLLAGIVAAASADAAEPAIDHSEVMAYQGDIVLTQVEIDAAFSKLPEEDRLRFIRDGGKVDQLIRALLKRKVIAADAKRAGFDQDRLIAARVSLEAERELAQAWTEKLMSEVPAADYEALAREDYLAHPDTYRTPELLDVSHILIGTDDRTPAAALALVNDLASRLQQDPSVFDALVEEYSDDPAKVNNAGRYQNMERGMMAKPFEAAAFALTEAGSISPPVQTDYGWHLIRLNGRSGNELQEFDAVKDEAMQRAENRHYESYRENYMRRVLIDPVVIPAESVENMAKRHFGENLELAPNPGR